MDSLFQYSQQNPQLSASDALRQLVASFQHQPQNHINFNAAMQHPGLNPALQPPAGQRTPSYNGPNQFTSPAGTFMNLPMGNTGASPATMNMSPAMQNHALQSHLQQQQQQPPTSVGMIAQQSQQGTNTSGGTGSQVTSSNPSPNVNKRRRPSGVKTESDDPGVGGDINGTNNKVKQSPRVGNKRQKGTG
jgi:hypothetical protein